ncbi:hypothetical protein [Sphingobacterium zeae]|uniref:Uncharacterized protein n=1 Tax=Sphingobacterium zeae TaxID=1776859 RepID=A0ABU0U6B7_9SPHI|nr:hypothetical protein [Sphingobacterium zeae]
MKAPINRIEYERNINILLESIKKGRFQTDFKPHITSLINIKKSPNRRFEFKTIDENVRLLANMEAHLNSKNKI